MIQKIKIILKEHSGSSMLFAAFIAFGIFVVSLLCYEYAHLSIVSQGIRNAVQDAATQSCSENYARLYDGVREGYSGGYALDGSDRWSQNIDPGDTYGKLDATLKMRGEGAVHTRYDSNGKTEYSISDLSIQMTNTPFAPDDPDNAHKLTCVAYVTLTLPTGFNWGVPPMQARLRVIAGYSPKF